MRTGSEASRPQRDDAEAKAPPCRAMNCRASRTETSFISGHLFCSIIGNLIIARNLGALSSIAAPRHAIRRWCGRGLARSRCRLCYGSCRGDGAGGRLLLVRLWRNTRTMVPGSMSDRSVGIWSCGHRSDVMRIFPFDPHREPARAHDPATKEPLTFLTPGSDRFGFLGRSNCGCDKMTDACSRRLCYTFLIVAGMPLGGS